jgi:hypothetical protein
MPRFRRSRCRGFGVHDAVNFAVEEGKQLKGTRWSLLKSFWNLSLFDSARLSQLQRDNKRLYRAYGFHSAHGLIALLKLCCSGIHLDPVHIHPGSTHKKLEESPIKTLYALAGARVAASWSFSNR